MILFVFFNAAREEAQTVYNILRDYRRLSGQLINYQESGLFFSKNTIPELRRDLSVILSIPIKVDLGRYLGLPDEIGKSKSELFSYVKVRVLQNLAGWKVKLLSQAVKEILLPSVVLAYVCNVLFQTSGGALQHDFISYGEFLVGAKIQ